MRDEIYKSPPIAAKDFAFDDTVASVFDDMVQRSVPFYGELQRMVVELGSQFLLESGIVYDVGSSTGTTIAALLERLGPDSRVEIVGIEPSEPMRAKARKKLANCAGNERVRFLSEGIESFECLPGAQVIVILFTLQFVRPIHRHQVLDMCWRSLAPSGCLILAEKILADHSMLTRMYIDCYHSFKRRSGYSVDEITRKREALENILVPYTDAENYRMLVESGFRVVDRFFRWYNFAAYLALKT